MDIIRREGEMIEDQTEMVWVCPHCGSVYVSQSIEDKIKGDGTYEWYCIDCYWQGPEDMLKEKEVPR